MDRFPSGLDPNSHFSPVFQVLPKDCRRRTVLSYFASSFSLGSPPGYLAMHKSLVCLLNLFYAYIALGLPDLVRPPPDRKPSRLPGGLGQSKSRLVRNELGSSYIVLS